MQKMKLGEHRVLLNDQRGSALIELALIFPLFAMLCMVGLEFSRSLKYLEGAGSISREAASQGFRNCIRDYRLDVEADPAAQQKVNACLKNVSDGATAFAVRQFPGAEVIVSLFRYGNVVPAPENCTGNLGADDIVRVGVGGPETPNYQTKLKFVAVNGAPLPAATRRGQQLDGGFEKRSLCLTRTLLVAEVFLPYTSFSGTASNLFSFNPTEFYSVATM